ncbi:MAG: hypothetical protein ABIG40_00360 [Parcubacteria group bacterium]
METKISFAQVVLTILKENIGKPVSVIDIAEDPRVAGYRITEYSGIGLIRSIVGREAIGILRKQGYKIQTSRIKGTHIIPRSPSQMLYPAERAYCLLSDEPEPHPVTPVKWGVFIPFSSEEDASKFREALKYLIRRKVTIVKIPS